QSRSDTASVQSLRLKKTNKRGAKTQVTQLLSQPDSVTTSSISHLEDVFIKSELESTTMKDVMKEIATALQPQNGSKSLLTKDETKCAMELDLAIAKGQFISQFMKDNKVNYEQEKLIADNLYKCVEAG
ncbi:hypothetical protein DFH28DRAFT_883824, partial [Melampsora americana]